MPEFLLLAQAAPPSAAALGSVWDFLVKGGVLMIPIGICSLVVLAVTVERLISLRKRNVIPPDFLTGVQAAIGRGGSAGRSAALDYCKKSDSPIGRIFVAALQRIGEPADLLEKHIEQAGQREVFKLRKYLRLLSVIASVATLLGLLGTIFGMITAFSTVAASGEALGRTELLARGIYEALITTAAGLMVSIPALLAFHGFAARIDHIVRDVDAMTVDFVESLRRTDDKPALVAEAA